MIEAKNILDQTNPPNDSNEIDIRLVKPRVGAGFQAYLIRPRGFWGGLPDPPTRVLGWVTFTVNRPWI